MSWGEGLQGSSTCEGPAAAGGVAEHLKRRAEARGSGLGPAGHTQRGGVTVGQRGEGRLGSAGDSGPGPPARLARSLPSWACAAHSCTMGRLLGVGERKERSEGRGTGLPWDEAAGPIPPATKLPKKASPAERRGPSGSQQAPAAQPTARNSPPPPCPTPAPWTLGPAWVNAARLRAGERDPRCL